MIHRKETLEILSRLAELDAAGRRAALATVVRIAGSAYRRPGAKFLIEEDGETLGSVSGGCLEADVRAVGLDVLSGGEPRLLRYDTGAGDEVVWGLGLGCNGVVEIFVQAATGGPFAAGASRLRELLTGEAAVALVTAVQGEASAPSGASEPSESFDVGQTLVVPVGAAGPAGQVGEDGTAEPWGTLGSAGADRLAVERARALLAAGLSQPPAPHTVRSTLEPVDGRMLFFDLLQPPRHLLVCGAGDDAQPLVRYAADAGFRVTVLDHRPGLLTAGRFPEAHQVVHARPDERPDTRPDERPDLPLPSPARTLAVVMTHSLGHDREWARRLLAAGVSYVGLLGPRDRTQAVREEIGAADDPRVHGPVGLDLGADGPRQVALSIMAELLAVTSGREPRHLSTRKEAIHAV